MNSPMLNEGVQSFVEKISDIHCIHKDFLQCELYDVEGAQSFGKMISHIHRIHKAFSRYEHSDGERGCSFC